MNFILKSKIAAFALKENIRLISVFKSNLILEGKKLSYVQAKELRKIEGHYWDSKKKITIPLDRIIDVSDDNLFFQIFEFLAH